MESGVGCKRMCIATEGVTPLSEIYGFEVKANNASCYVSAELADSEDAFDVKLAGNRIIRRMLLNKREPTETNMAG